MNDKEKLKEMIDLLVIAAMLCGEISIAGMLSLTDIVSRLPNDKQKEFSKVAHDWLKANSEDFEKFSIDFDAKVGIKSDTPDDVPPNIKKFLDNLK